MKGHSQADPEGYEAEQKQRNITPGTRRFLASSGYASGPQKCTSKQGATPKIHQRMRASPKHLLAMQMAACLARLFETVGICAHSSVVAPHMLPRSGPSKSTLHPGARLDLALHLLELLVHVEQFFPLRLSRRRRRLCQSPVKLLVLDVISLKLL
jgi:hypothetical protein